MQYCLLCTDMQENELARLRDLRPGTHMIHTTKPTYFPAFLYTSHRGRHDENEERQEGGHEVVRVLDFRVPLLFRLHRGNLGLGRGWGAGSAAVVDRLWRDPHIQSVVFFLQL